MHRPTSIGTCCPRAVLQHFGIWDDSLLLRHLERTAAYSFACFRPYEVSKERPFTGSFVLGWVATDRVALATTRR